MALSCACHAKAGCVLEAAASTSQHGAAPKEKHIKLKNAKIVCRIFYATSVDTPLRSLFLGMRRSTRARDTRALCRAGCGLSMRDTRPLHRREASLHRRKIVLRRASCGLQDTAGFRVARTRARHCARCLSRRGAARAPATRARHAALAVVNLQPTQGHDTGEASFSIGARPWCAVPAAAFNTQPAFAWRARERATALAVYGAEAQL